MRKTLATALVTATCLGSPLIGYTQEFENVDFYNIYDRYSFAILARSGADIEDLAARGVDTENRCQRLNLSEFEQARRHRELVANINEVSQNLPDRFRFTFFFKSNGEFAVGDRGPGCSRISRMLRLISIGQYDFTTESFELNIQRDLETAVMSQAASYILVLPSEFVGSDYDDDITSLRLGRRPGIFFNLRLEPERAEVFAELVRRDVDRYDAPLFKVSCTHEVGSWSGARGTHRRIPCIFESFSVYSGEQLVYDIRYENGVWSTFPSPTATDAKSTDAAIAGAQPSKAQLEESDLELPLASSTQRADAEDGATSALGALIAQAEALHTQALSAPEAQRLRLMAEVQAMLDRIVEEYPTSDEAIAILLGLPMGNIPTADVADMAAAVPATASAPEALPNTGIDPVAALSACYRLALEQGQAVAESATITVEAQVGPEGELIGIPTLALPATPDATARRMFQNALAALDICAPPPGELIPTELELAGPPLLSFSTQTVSISFDTDQVLTVAVIDAERRAPAVEEAAPAPAAAIDTQAWQIATEAEERALALDTATRREIQGRLTAIGHDTRGVDGAIGPNSRRAMEAWQESRGWASTGFINSAQLAELRRQSQTEYERWQAANAAAAPRNRTVAPRGRTPVFSHARKSEAERRADLRRCGARFNILGQLVISRDGVNNLANCMQRLGYRVSYR